MVVGPSPVPSRYVVRIDGVPHFVRCAADILLTGLRRDVEAEARCPVCESSIRMRLRDGRIDRLDPAGAVLHVVERLDGGRRTIACEPTHLFDRAACLEAWRAGHGGDGIVETPRAFLDRWSRA